MKGVLENRYFEICNQNFLKRPTKKFIFSKVGHPTLRKVEHAALLKLNSHMRKFCKGLRIFVGSLRKRHSHTRKKCM